MPGAPLLRPAPPSSLAEQRPPAPPAAPCTRGTAYRCSRALGILAPRHLPAVGPPPRPLDFPLSGLHRALRAREATPPLPQAQHAVLPVPKSAPPPLSPTPA